jgi:dephospho-CoA kinase
MKIFGVVGQNGSGKDEVVKYLRDLYGIPFLSSGDMVRALAAKRRLEPTRENLGRLTDEEFRLNGPGIFIKRVAEEITRQGWQQAGITGIRSPDDVALLRQAFGSCLTLVEVYVTDPRRRFERMTRRGEGRDPLDYRQFLDQDEAEEKRFRLKKTASLADFHLANNGTLDDLRQAIGALLSSRRLLAD